MDATRILTIWHVLDDQGWHSAQDIHAKLGFTVSSVTNVLNHLAAKGLLEVKEHGQQKVYRTKQQAFQLETNYPQREGG